ncbi:MAG: peptidoglycan DD-metalloendopeptidase family protein [Oscillospiraceae bacterium]|nr:peptidoglycan DD-metalloendopeptidase family protein [Oscillospiraceae bacterium]
MRKDRKNSGRTILSLILAMAMLLGVTGMIQPTVAQATNDKSSAQIQQEIDGLKGEKEALQAEIDALRGQMSDSMDSMEEVVDQKNLIDQEIFLLYEQIANINAQILAYGVMIADKQEELDIAEGNLATLQDQNRARIRAMEKNSRTSYWSVVFKADNFLDMLDRLNAIFKINKADQELIEDLTEAADEVARVRDELQTQKDALDETKQELEEAQGQLETKRAEADELLAELMTEYQGYEDMVEQAESNQAQLDTEIGELEEEYEEAKDREYKIWYEQWLAQQQAQQQQQQQNKPSSSGGGQGGNTNVTNGIKWLVPCNFTRISSPYGWRIHPVHGDRRFHSGIDLAGPMGTPIYATRAGKVTIAKYSSSAGYYVHIDHGDGFGSRYMHMTHYVVRAGQSVSQGQVIGYMGSTGTSTGSHLHLSLYLNGSTVNPANYIKF